MSNMEPTWISPSGAYESQQNLSFKFACKEQESERQHKWKYNKLNNDTLMFLRKKFACISTSAKVCN